MSLYGAVCIDMIVEHNTVQVIQFMLKGNGGKSLEPHFKLFAIRIECFHRYSRIPRNKAVYVPIDGKAAFT